MVTCSIGFLACVIRPRTQARKPMLLLATSLAKQLADDLKEVGAEMPKLNSSYDSNKEPARKGGKGGGGKGKAGKKPMQNE